MVRAPNPSPRAEHPTSIAVLQWEPGGYYYADRRGSWHPRSGQRRDREAVVQAAIDAGFAMVIDRDGNELARRKKGQH